MLRVLGGDGQALQDTARPDAGPSTGREESDVRLLQYGVANGVGVTCEIQVSSCAWAAVLINGFVSRVKHFIPPLSIMAAM